MKLSTKVSYIYKILRKNITFTFTFCTLITRLIKASVLLEPFFYYKHLKFHNALVLCMAYIFFLRRSTNFTNWIYLIFRKIERVLFTLIKARLKILLEIIFKPFYNLMKSTLRFSQRDYIIETLSWPRNCWSDSSISLVSSFYSSYNHLQLKFPEWLHDRHDVRISALIVTSQHDSRCLILQLSKIPSWPIMFQGTLESSSWAIVNSGIKIEYQSVRVVSG